MPLDGAGETCLLGEFTQGRSLRCFTRFYSSAWKKAVVPPILLATHDEQLVIAERHGDRPVPHLARGPQPIAQTRQVRASAMSLWVVADEVPIGLTCGGGAPW